MGGFAWGVLGNVAALLDVSSPTTWQSGRPTDPWLGDDKLRHFFMSFAATASEIPQRPPLGETRLLEIREIHGVVDVTHRVAIPEPHVERVGEDGAHRYRE